MLILGFLGDFIVLEFAPALPFNLCSLIASTGVPFSSAFMVILTTVLEFAVYSWSVGPLER
jgi:hypothetical protein